MRLTSLFAIAAVMATPLAAQTAPAPHPGARAGDKQMTCEMVSAEREQIAAAASRRSEAKLLAAKRKKSAFGFLKTVAAQVVPGQALGIGGIGGQAAYVASGQAIAAADAQGGKAPAAASPTQTKEETDRLARLDQIAAYRTCAG